VSKILGQQTDPIFSNFIFFSRR